MQFKVERLRQSLTLIEPAIPRKSAIKLLNNHVLFKEGKMVATNLEQSVFIDLPEITEATVIPHGPILDLLGTVPGSYMLSATIEGKSLKLEWEGGEAAFPVESAEDYPDVNRYDAPTVMADVDGSPLVKALFEMAPYAATEDSRPVLRNLAIFPGEKIDVAAADGFRLIYETLPISFGNAEAKALLVPAEVANVLKYLWEKTPTEVSLKGGLIEQIMSRRMITLTTGNGGTDNPTWIGFRFGTVKLVSRLADGNFPKYRDLIPKNLANKVQFMAPYLVRAISKLKNIAKESGGTVKLQWDPEKGMKVSASADEVGQVATTIPANSLDGPGHVALSYKYLNEYLSKKDSTVLMSSDGKGTRPVLFEYDGAPNTIIMPHNIKW